MKMRRSDRLVADEGRIRRIIDDSAVCRVALHDEEGLYIVPMNFGCVYNEGKLTLYFHSATDGRKIRAIKASGEAAFEMDCMGNVTEGPNACSYSCVYSSVTGAGKASLVEDTEEKKRALSLIVEHTAHRHFDFDDKAAATVAIIRLDAETFSAKEKIQ